MPLQIFFLLFAALVMAASSRAADPTAIDLVLNAKRIAFLGDSITHDGRYVAAVASWLERSGIDGEVIDVGLSSETVSGLSEEGHAGGKFPRPDLFERLDRVLRVVRPDLVFACYGMNCGIYKPFDEERFERFKAGIERLHAVVEQGAVGIHLLHVHPHGRGWETDRDVHVKLFEYRLEPRLERARVLAGHVAERQLVPPAHLAPQAPAPRPARRRTISPALSRIASPTCRGCQVSSAVRGSVLRIVTTSLGWVTAAKSTLRSASASRNIPKGARRVTRCSLVPA